MLQFDFHRHVTWQIACPATTSTLSGTKDAEWRDHLSGGEPRRGPAHDQSRGHRVQVEVSADAVRVFESLPVTDRRPGGPADRGARLTAGGLRTGGRAAERGAGAVCGADPGNGNGLVPDLRTPPSSTERCRPAQPACRVSMTLASGEW